MTCSDSLRRTLYQDDRLLEYFCIFDSEQKRFGKTWLTKRTLFRCAFAAFIVPIILGWGVLYPWHEYPQYLTNWGHILVLGSLCFSAYMPYVPDYRRRPCLMASHHLLFSMAVCVILIICGVYWSMLH